MPKIFSSLRSRAIVMVFLAILPLLVLTVYSDLEKRSNTAIEVQRDALIAARYLATVQETIIGSTRQILANLAQSPQVQRRDLQGCAILFDRLLKQNPYYDVIGVTDPDGQLWASAPAVKDPVNIADRLYFQKAFHNRVFAVGEPLLCRISGKYSIDLSYPIWGDLGRVKGIVFAGIDLRWLGNLLVKSDYSPGTGLILTGAAGQILFRYPEPLEYVGKMLPEPAVKAMAAQVEGVVESREISNDLRLIGFTRLAPPWQDLRVAVSLSKKQALESVNREFRRDLIWLTVAMVLAVMLAYFGANISILNPVNKLLEVTRRLTHGDLAARSGARHKSGELGQLAQAFDQMANSLQERDADLKKTAAELQQRVQELNRRSLELAAANKELENFTYSVAHDLRAPLRAIGGFARVMLEDYPDKLDANGVRYLNIIHQDARKMGQLIDDLLDLARLGRKEIRFAPLGMVELVQEIFADLKAANPERNLQIEIEPLPAAQGDRAMIQQVLAKLLVNAVKFTRDRDNALIQVSGWADEHDHVYCIRDNGVGFNMKYVNKLFGAFQRLHSEKEFEGTGMGLATAKRIIERHGGRIWAESAINEGAAFYFTLPKKSVS